MDGAAASSFRAHVAADYARPPSRTVAPKHAKPPTSHAPANQPGTAGEMCCLQSAAHAAQAQLYLTRWSGT